MVAAHMGRSEGRARARAAHGFHLPAQWKYASHRQPDKSHPGRFDVVSTSMLDLAAKMGA